VLDILLRPVTRLAAQDFDLSLYLLGCGNMRVRGKRLADLSYAKVFYDANGYLVLVIIHELRSPQVWILYSWEQLLDCAKQNLSQALFYNLFQTLPKEGE
jgi:hypothetical protein